MFQAPETEGEMWPTKFCLTGLLICSVRRFWLESHAKQISTSALCITAPEENITFYRGDDPNLWCFFPPSGFKALGRRRFAKSKSCCCLKYPVLLKNALIALHILCQVTTLSWRLDTRSSHVSIVVVLYENQKWQPGKMPQTTKKNKFSEMNKSPLWVAMEGSEGGLNHSRQKHINGALCLNGCRIFLRDMNVWLGFVVLLFCFGFFGVLVM